MPAFRRLIALLLMLTLPAYAGAALGVAPPPCPMHATAVSTMADAAPSCCDTEAGTPDQPRACEAGQECKSGSLFHPLPPRATQSFGRAAVVAGSDSPVLSRDAHGVWRPPRSG